MMDLIGMRLGEFNVVRELGRGGMGVVYEAVQTSLNRRVALKVLGPGLGLTPRSVERFKREAEAAAKLHHTNIVPVYATGEQDGTHFFAMELIDGPSLDTVIRQLRERQSTSVPSVPSELLTTGAYVPADPFPSSTGSGPGTGSSADRYDRVAALVADVADALHHAHDSGVTHRDIKPSNLLLAADGRVRVTDFGLARMLEQPGMTVTGEFVGTPAYMSPEQITAGRVLVDHRTDIYSLGATLYQLLTLRPPFVADGRDRLLAMVIQKDPPSLRSIDPKVPKDLETICLKALEKDPDRRYQTAAAMADDLRRFVNRFAILAKRAGPISNLTKWAKRNPAVAGLLVLVVVAASFAGVFAYQRYQLAERRQADETRHAEEVRAERLRGAMERASLEAMGGRYDEAETALGESEQLGASAGEVRFLRAIIALNKGDTETAVREAKSAVTLLPESLAATALLAHLSNETGNVEQYEALLAACMARTPKTADDFLFRGQARTNSDPAGGLADLDEAIRRRPSALAMVIRSDARTIRAEDTGRVEDARLAVQAVEQSRELLPAGTPPIGGVSSAAKAVASQVLRKAGLDAEARQFLEGGARDVRELMGTKSTAALWTRGVYLHVQKDTAGLAALAREIENLGADKVDMWTANPYTAARIRSGQAAHALEFLNRSPGRALSGVAGLRVWLMLEADGNNGRALAELRQLAVGQTASQDILNDLELWFFAGAPEEGVARAREFRSKLWKKPVGRPEWHQGALDYLCGDVTDEQLMALARGSVWNTALSHTTIGFVHLSQKKFDTAAAHFKAYRECRVLLFSYIHKFALIDELLEKDPTWPPWIKGKK